MLAQTWDFGDGATSRDAQPIHSYHAPGTYTAVLEVSDGRGGHATATRTVEVGAALTQLPGPGAPLAGLVPVSTRRGVALIIGGSGARASRNGLVTFRLKNRYARRAAGVLTLKTAVRRPRRLARRVFVLPPRGVGSVRVRLSRGERRRLAARRRLRVLVGLRYRIRGAAALQTSKIRTSLLAPRRR